MERISKIEFPIHLRLRDVVLAAKEARENGTLQALASPSGCSYWCERTQTRCAIGQAFTPEAARELQWKVEEMVIGNVRSLHDSGLIATDDIDALGLLQRAHDGVEAQYALDEDGCETNVLIGPKAETLLYFDAVIENLLARLPA